MHVPSNQSRNNGHLNRCWCDQP